MRVRELMTHDVRSCRPHQTLNEAAQAMWEADCGAVPVVDDGRRVVGMLTDRDICMAAYTQGKPLAAILVKSVMTKQVLSCRPDDELAAAERTMQQARVRRVPVVDGEGRLTGILALGDLARQAGRDKTSKARAVSADEIAATVSAVSEPRNGRQAQNAGLASEAKRSARLIAKTSPEAEC